MRKQYYFKPSFNGFYAWDVDKLVVLSSSLPVMDIELNSIRELDENFWYRAGDVVPTCRSIVEHLRLIQECDLKYPIILAADGSVMDGMHRVCKASLLDLKSIKATRFPKTPAPDYGDVYPDDLPY